MEWLKYGCACEDSFSVQDFGLSGCVYKAVLFRVLSLKFFMVICAILMDRRLSHYTPASPKLVPDFFEEERP